MAGLTKCHRQKWVEYGGFVQHELPARDVRLVLVITVRRTKYLNNIIEQDHRFIKKLTRPTQTFKSLNSASATLDGIEVAHMIRKGQFDQPEQSGFEQFAALAG